MIVCNPLNPAAWWASAVMHLMSGGAIRYRVPCRVPRDGAPWRLVEVTA